ncbi:PACE efflux transporter [Rahnella variigena]|jgi:uncharacterized membrane protein|uniref:Chlorhexidine efflux transporter domain-containing protein n=2 Tax=Yersiniaceae TaxID=1903411 RepID=A0ABX9PNV2_9GAMM|nr:PACE efflux transporter [Rahnella variigena]RJT50943.1 PACE efflux transporter [Rahnella variigena]RKF66563.1 hypothetical protein CKQ54_24590 [Rahnella variigena]
MKVELNKSTAERIFHAVLFELLGNVVIAIFISTVLKVSLLQSGKLSVISAITATIWNYIFNKIFDAIQRRFAFERNFTVRILHAVIFEIVLVLSLTPVAMFLLDLSLAKAFMVEIGLIFVFLPYTLVFNWTYDYIRWRFVANKASA